MQLGIVQDTTALSPDLHKHDKENIIQTLVSLTFINPLSSTGRAVRLAVISLKIAMHFAIYIVYFSSRKTTRLSGSWRHPHKFRRKVKAFIFRDFLFCYRAVTKISTVYKFLKGRGAAHRRWQFQGMKLS